jgi:hypothetical protein
LYTLFPKSSFDAANIPAAKRSLTSILKSQQMRKCLVTVLNILIALTSFSQPHTVKTILGIFAHPDDENMVGSVLAKYARQGSKVYVIIATDGKYGTRVTKIP